MDALYSLTLLLALVAGGGGVLLGAAAFRSGSRVVQLARWSAVVALVAGAVSLGVHVAFGHAPGGPEALGPITFFAVHPAYLGVVGLAVVGLGLAWQAERA